MPRAYRDNGLVTAQARMAGLPGYYPLRALYRHYIIAPDRKMPEYTRLVKHLGRLIGTAFLLIRLGELGALRRKIAVLAEA